MECVTLLSLFKLFLSLRCLSPPIPPDRHNSKAHLKVCLPTKSLWATSDVPEELGSTSLGLCSSGTLFCSFTLSNQDEDADQT